jgi:hypothetical protein
VKKIDFEDRGENKSEKVWKKEVVMKGKRKRCRLRWEALLIFPWWESSL